MKLLIQVCLIAVVAGSVNPANAQVLSREKAMANGVLQAIGGYEAYQNLPFVSWTFFGKRTLIWDKYQSRVRIDYADGSLSLLVHLYQDEVRVIKNGTEITHPDSLNIYLQKGRQIWMNDSYWLFMPYKLLDKGVYLKYLGQGETLDDQVSEVLQLTFDQVGLTPLNKYHLHIDPNTNLIVQWDYFVRAEDEFPTFTNPWTNYKWYGTLRLASGRGAFGDITNIQTYTRLPESIFTQLQKPPRL